jgi:hypothetical protein
MKRISIAIALASSLLVSACRQTPQRVQVTAQTLAGQPAGKAYVIDLTRTGTVYDVAAGINYSLVRVRTSTGEMPLSDLARNLGRTGPILLGTFSDLRAQNFGFPPGGGTFQPPDGGPVAADCPQTGPDAGLCLCKGYKDCNDLDKSGKCLKDGWGCSKGSCVCVAKKTPG